MLCVCLDGQASIYWPLPATTPRWGIEVDARIFADFWQARKEHILALKTALNHSTPFDCKEAYGIWIRAVSQAFQHSSLAQFEQLLPSVAKTKQKAEDVIVAAFVPIPPLCLLEPQKPHIPHR